MVTVTAGKNSQGEFAETDENRKEFANRLRESIPHGWSQERFAKSVDASLSGLKNWLSGTSEPGRPYLEAIARVTGVSVRWLVMGEGDKDSKTGAVEGVLDMEVLEFAFEMSEKIFLNKGISSERKAKMFAHIYNDALAEKAKDE